ncbi:hypothetical protein THAOC_14564 [Thalassiosira oceanica]|uniref:Uncharacterized protein n=1 Tax=Thalassiosira oceanica TaxID=159749 RepID=K0SUN1_THAOC|nr:hypothetical protein THAOC_14564 [Thalassiosira oceanica]|eukprot:EJK64681.1 hypothetical protein THAOC_14564 [Thalassiosira oceanica]
MADMNCHDAEVALRSSANKVAEGRHEEEGIEPLLWRVTSQSFLASNPLCPLSSLPNTLKILGLGILHRTSTVCVSPAFAVPHETNQVNDLTPVGDLKLIKI